MAAGGSMMDERDVARQGAWRGQAERPRIRPPRSTAEVVFTSLALLGMLALLAITAYWWPTLPATIPTHFGFDGTPNAYGSRNTVWLLPGILLFLIVFMAVLSRFPWAFNFPVRITQENAARQYRRGRLLLEGVSALDAWFFVYVQWETTQVALGKTAALGGIFSPFFVIAFLVLFPLILLAVIVLWATRGR